MEKYNFILKIKTKDNTRINNKKFPKIPEKADINGSKTGLGNTAELDTKQKRKHWEMVEEEEEKMGNCLGKITKR